MLSYRIPKVPVKGVEETVGTILGMWHKYSKKVKGFRILIQRDDKRLFFFSLSRHGERAMVEHPEMPDTLVSERGLPKVIVSLVEEFLRPDQSGVVTARIESRRDPRNVPTGMHVEWIRPISKVSHHAVREWQPYVEYARRVRAEPYVHGLSNNTVEETVKKVSSGYYESCELAQLVNNQNGRVIGHAFIDVPQPGERMELEKLFVDPEQRRRGGAGLLMRAVEQRAKELGASRIRIDSSAEGESFYDGEGYRRRSMLSRQFHKNAPNFRYKIPFHLASPGLHV